MLRQVVRAPGKLILLGEYAVLAGHRALVVAVDRHARCRFEAGDTAGGVVVDAGEHGRFGWPGDAVTLPLVDALFTANPPPPGRYHLDSDALYADTPAGRRKLGLGSSAATTVALAAAIGVGDATAVYRVAQAAHRRVQGTGSGADVAASAYGGALAYAWFDAPGHGLDAADGSAVIERLASPLTTVDAVWSGDSASTPKLVAAVDAWAQRDPSGHQQRLAAIAAAADDGITAAAAAGRDAVDALGRAAGVALCTATHHALDALARPYGAVVKPTGAGGGDLAWVCGPDDEGQARARAALEAAGHRVFRFAVEPAGVG